MIDLEKIAADLDARLTENRRPAMNDENIRLIQALCVAEEAGELVGAFRRYSGMARRAGTIEELSGEVADVIIVTCVFALRMGISVEEALKGKLGVIYSRGWKEEG